MKFKTTLRLFFAVCITGGMIWLIERNSSRRTMPNSRLFEMVAEDISHLTIDIGDMRVNCAKKAEGWHIVSPLRSRAGDEAVKRILGVIEVMRKVEIVTLEQMTERALTLDHYGLEKPRVKLLFQDGRGWHELQIGNDSALGEFVYARIVPGDEIIVTTKAIMGVLPKKIDQLRDRTILHGEASRTTRLEIKHSGAPFIQLSQSEGSWTIQQPVAARGDTGKILKMLDALYSIDAEQFTWDPIVQEEGKKEAVAQEPSAVAEKYGLAGDSASQITVWLIGDSVGKQLLLGSDVEGGNGSIYAKRRDLDAIYTINRSVKDVFSTAVNTLRDRNLFAMKPGDVKHLAFQEGDKKLVLKKDKGSSWTIVEPVQWEADEQYVIEVIGKMLDMKTTVFLDGSKANLKSLGLDPPVMSLEISDEIPVQAERSVSEEAVGVGVVSKDDGGSSERLLIGKFPEDGKGTVFAKFEGSDTLMRIEADLVRAIGEHPAEPLAYRDRTILSIPPVHINSISLKKGDKLQVVERGEEGKWKSVDPATNRVDQKVVSDMMFYVSNLRAHRTEAYNPKREALAGYGLDRSLITLTFGLSEEEGIQKSIILGFKAGTDGIYAMVQGLDVVFVLEKGLVGQITRSLSSAPLQNAQTGENSPAVTTVEASSMTPLKRSGKK